MQSEFQKGTTSNSATNHSPKTIPQIILSVIILLPQTLMTRKFWKKLTHFCWKLQFFSSFRPIAATEIFVTASMLALCLLVLLARAPVSRWFFKHLLVFLAFNWSCYYANSKVVKKIPFRTSTLSNMKIVTFVKCDANLPTRKWSMEHKAQCSCLTKPKYL